MSLPLGWECQGLRVVRFVDANEWCDAVKVREKDKLCLSLEARVMMRRENPYVVKWKRPATWWDHFKQTYADKFPRWFLKRFPVRMKEETTTVEVKALYPYIERVKHPKHTPQFLTIMVEDQPIGTVQAVPPLTPPPLIGN